METVLRSILIYFVLFIIFRVSGKRTMEETTPFGLILILLISTAVADAMKNEDKSLTNGILQAITLMSIHILASRVKLLSRKTEKVMGDIPTLLLNNGVLLADRMKQARITRENILQAARAQKIMELGHIKYAILEIDGTISIIPKEKEKE
jgi:uncharacterized membrane protein YcaP (DUF421 family)